MIETKLRTTITNRMGESKSQHMQSSLFKRKLVTTDTTKGSNRSRRSSTSSFEVSSVDGYNNKPTTINVDETLVFTIETTTFDDVIPYPHSEITEMELEDLKELEQTFGKEWYLLFCFESSIRAYNSSNNKRQKVEESN